MLLALLLTGNSRRPITSAPIFLNESKEEVQIEAERWLGFRVLGRPDRLQKSRQFRRRLVLWDRLQLLERTGERVR